mmetsp:Transcript_44388/g.94472  ORF Transcript_44388/g.94472 Transcript_44388/m.94472 type:complete len:239 (+) Transcript_44388:97-813(+)
MTAETASIISSLEARISSLERSSWGTIEDVAGSPPSITPALRRARRHVQSSRCFSSLWKHCPPRYYSLSLDDRRAVLGAHSTGQLCKACLFENKNYKPDHEDGDGEEGADNDPTNSRYYLVVVQYVESIDVKKLASELRGLRPSGGGRRLGPNYFSDLRLAPEDASERLTGYGHNGVSPFGMLDRSVPVVVCKSVTDVVPKFVWMGGGDKDWKLGMAVSEFVRGLDAIVLDVSEPRAV